VGGDGAGGGVGGPFFLKHQGRPLAWLAGDQQQPPFSQLAWSLPKDMPQSIREPVVSSHAEQ
jgi:hypothetical protein